MVCSSSGPSLFQKFFNFSNFPVTLTEKLVVSLVITVLYNRLKTKLGYSQWFLVATLTIIRLVTEIATTTNMFFH